MTPSAGTNVAGSMQASITSTPPMSSASGNAEVVTATTASSTRPTSLVRRETSSPLRCSSWNDIGKRTAVPNVSSRRSAPIRSAPPSASRVTP